MQVPINRFAVKQLQHLMLTFQLLVQEAGQLFQEPEVLSTLQPMLLQPLPAQQETLTHCDGQ